MYEFDEYIILTGVLLCFNDVKERSLNLNAAAQISIAPFTNYMCRYMGASCAGWTRRERTLLLVKHITFIILSRYTVNCVEIYIFVSGVRTCNVSKNLRFHFYDI